MSKLKTLTVPAVIFLLLIGGAQSASASDWVEVAENTDGWVHFIDRDSIQAKSYSSIVSVWIKAVYPSKAYRLVLFEFDFSDRTWQELVKHEYDSSGNRTGSETLSQGWEYIIPDTIAEIIYQTLREWLNR